MLLFKIQIKTKRNKNKSDHLLEEEESKVSAKLNALRGGLRVGVGVGKYKFLQRDFVQTKLGSQRFEVGSHTLIFRRPLQNNVSIIKMWPKSYLIRD